MASSEKHLPSEELQQALKAIASQYELEGKPTREWQLRKWKRLKFLWEGFSNIWWDSVAHDWRVWDIQNVDGDAGDQFASYYDKPANIFKALLESIIAALSVQVPGIVGVPEDADNPLDILTAKSAQRICELIGRHNNFKMLWLHALYIYFTEGTTFIYNYEDKNNKYGTYNELQYKDEETTQQQSICPICKTNMPSVSLSNMERDEFDPGDEDTVGHDILFNKDENICPNCLIQVDPEFQEDKLIIPRLVGITSKPKSRQCIEAYGGLFVKIPNYCKTQEEVPILRFSRELDKSLVIEKFCECNEELAEKLRMYSGGTGSSVDSYEKWARLSPQFMGEYPRNTPTVNQYWIKPWAFNECTDKEIRTKLLKKYPDGCNMVMIDDEIAYCCNESLDDHWTISRNPLSMYIHSEPAGESLVPMQEVTNEIIALNLQTIEHGISQTFFDPAVLDAEAYKQQEAMPGQLFPAVPKAGKSLQESFYEVRTASLSAEVMPFMQFIQDMAQLTTGALPSLWGGAAPNSSKTASQYSMARAQALQRLQNQWEIFKDLWRTMSGKVIPQYIKCVKEDESYVQQDDRGNFVNVFIRVAELQGKIGSIELEASENLPISWAQKKDGIMQMLASSNPIIQSMLSNPANFDLIKSVVGVPELELPGGDQREFQFNEILALINSAPQSTETIDPQSGQPVQQQNTSVPINEFDNNQLHAEICTEYLVSEAGQLLKRENQQGYMNLLLHWKAHSDAIQQQQMQQLQMQEAMNQSKTSQAKQSSGSGNPQSAANNGDIRQPFIAPVRKNVITS